MNKQDKHTARINHTTRMAAIFLTLSDEILDDFTDTLANNFSK